MASRGDLHDDPPGAAPRPFSADYPTGASPDDLGKPLTHDKDGLRLGKGYIAGRRPHGGDDVGLTREELEAIGFKTTSRRIGVLPRHELSPKGDVDGRVQFREEPDGRISTAIDRADDLSPDEIRPATAHEVSHDLEMRAGKWPQDEEAVRRRDFGMPKPKTMENWRIEGQLYELYNDLNNPARQSARLEGRPIDKSPAFRNHGPRDDGYAPDREREELWTEAFRAYLTDPNDIKTLAPDVADAIRKAWNADPQRRKTVQFNSLAPLAGAGSLAGSGREEP